MLSKKLLQPRSQWQVPLFISPPPIFHVPFANSDCCLETSFVLLDGQGGSYKESLGFLMSFICLMMKNSWVEFLRWSSLNCSFLSILSLSLRSWCLGRTETEKEAVATPQWPLEHQDRPSALEKPFRNRSHDTQVQDGASKGTLGRGNHTSHKRREGGKRDREKREEGGGREQRENANIGQIVFFEALVGWSFQCWF